jgi:hypothetical protein
MEKFNTNIKTVNDKYNDIYITYFLYRILIKYRNLVIYSNNRDEFNKILKLLRIPEEYYTVNIVFPLSNFMFYSEKVEIDKQILSLLMNVDIKMKDIDNSVLSDIVEIKKDYDNLIKYIKECTEEKIADITNQFRKKINLQYRNIYIKGLIET